MGRVHGLVGSLVVAGLLAGCDASGGSTATPAGASVGAVSTEAPTTAPTRTAAATATPTAAPTRSPTARPSNAGPVVLTSTMYPYRLTVPSGPTSFVSAKAPWDGVQKFSSDTIMADRARVPGVGAVWLGMTDTTDPITTVAPDIEAKFSSWHGCKPPTARRVFTVGELDGVAFVHGCGPGNDTWMRAVIVGKGHMLVAFANVGNDPQGALDRLIEMFGGLEWTG